MEDRPARIGDAWEVKKDFKIDGGRIPAGICIIVDNMEVCRGTASAVLLACSAYETDSGIRFRKCHNGDIQLPYETLNHLIESDILDLFGTNVPSDHIDMQ